MEHEEIVCYEQSVRTHLTVSTDSLSSLTERVAKTVRTQEGHAQDVLTALMKINELQRANRYLRDENKKTKGELRDSKSKLKQVEAALKEEQHRHRHHANNDTAATDTSPATDKLTEAIHALRSVTLKQERKLKQLKQSQQHNNAELKDRDELIDTLSQQCDALKSAYQIKQAESLRGRREIKELQSDLASSIELVEDLEEKLQEQHARADAAAHRFQEAALHIQTLHQRLHQQVATAPAPPSPSSNKQIAHLEQELGTKTDRITLLEFQLQMARDEIQELQHLRSSSSNKNKSSSTTSNENHVTHPSPPLMLLDAVEEESTIDDSIDYSP
uniref:Uncharacterized protein n=1 Tax=Ditylum brightwellii TaxID=49249 RepID=A0A7S4V9U1_9STRA